MSRHLLVLGCSQCKLTMRSPIAAIERYDGSPYRVLRSYLRENCWPEALSIAVLSAKYGLMGGLTPIENYDQQMDSARAHELSDGVTSTLASWSATHTAVSLSLGQNYLPAIALDRLRSKGIRPTVFHGPIGLKLHQIRGLLTSLPSEARRRVEARERPAYFLPDWDDMLDPLFNFTKDKFSGKSRSRRGDVHCCKLMQPDRICDGVLVSLAQHVMSKGPLKRFSPTDATSLAPERLRARFSLRPDQALFGDCGAFSYVDEDEPTISVQEAVMLYELYGFDYGASVDHIPVQFVNRDGKKVELTVEQRARRVRTTEKNAAAFIEAWRRRRATFAPVGTLQALSAKQYGNQLFRYVDMGYDHIAVGGLVPRSDAEVLEVVEAVSKAASQLRRRPWIHLFGVFRPKIQPRLRELGVDSFDSATYFRKAWLRSEQNYLAADGQWYAAIRVPMTNDPRTKKRLGATGRALTRLQRLERQALAALQKYDAGRLTLEKALAAITEYDLKLSRSEDHGENLVEDYRRTLIDQPWRRCACPVCSSIGINALIFRGCNRNKRRGAHNTLMLYRMLHR